MPYKSDSQRRWAHSPTGEKALGGPEKVNEWDQATKGKKLPEKVKKMSKGGIVEDQMGPSEHCYADGGIVKPEDEMQGVAKPQIATDPEFQGKPSWNIGEQAQKAGDYVNKHFGKGSTVGSSNLKGMQNVMKQKQGYSDGGVVTSSPDWKEQLSAYLNKHFGVDQSAPIKRDVNEIQSVDALDPVVTDSTSTAQGFAYGLDPFDVSNSNSTANTQPIFNPQSGLPPAPPPPPAIPPVQPNEIAKLGLPPLPQTQPMAAQAPQLPPQLPPQSVAPQGNAVADYISQQKAKMGQYGPEQILATEKDIRDRQHSLGAVGSQAMGGLADALMQGVARAGPSHFQENIAGQQNAQGAAQMAALEKARGANVQNVEQGQKLDALDPTSPLSKGAQDTYGALLKRLGFKGPQIANMSASAIAQLTGQTVEALKAEAEAKMAAASMGLKEAEAKQAVTHQTAEERQHAAELGAKTDIYKSEHPILNYFNPVGNENPSSPVSNPNAHGIPDLGSTFNGGKVLKVTRIK